VLNTILARVLPRDARGAFLRGFGLSLGLGLAIIFVVGPMLGVSKGFGGRVHDGYLELGTNLAAGRGFVFEPGGPPCTHRPPLTPILLAPIARLPFAWQRPALILMHSLMVGATFFLLFDLARRAFDARVAAGSIGLMLGYPWLFWHVKNPMSMITQMTCTMLVVHLIGSELLDSFGNASTRRSRHWPARAGLLGLAGAAAILTHGTMLLSIPVLLLAVAAIGLVHHRRRLAAVAVLAGVVAALAVAPWSYRNWRVCHRFVPVVTGAGLQYFYGNALWGFDGHFTWQDRWERALAMAGVENGPSRVVHFCGWKDPELDREANRRMVEDIASHPARFARKIALNAIELYLPAIRDAIARTGPKGTTARHLALSAWHSFYWALAVWGTWGLRRSRLRPRLWLMLAGIFVLSVFYLPFVTMIGHSGYTLQTLPLLSVLASVGWLCKSADADVPSRSRSGRVSGRPAPPHFERNRAKDPSSAVTEAALPVVTD